MARDPNELSQAVVAHVRHFRRARGWSQERLAELLTEHGLPWTRDNVVNMEGRPTFRVTVDAAVHFAAVLGTTVDGLLETAAGECPRCSGRPPAGFACGLCRQEGPDVP